MNYRRKTIAKIVAYASAALLSIGAKASYNCGGAVSYLGIASGGEVTVALSGTTPIHYICNISTQGSYAINTASCKAACAALMAAKITGRSIVLYYSDDGMTCGALPSWGGVPSTYFVHGPE